MAKDAHIPPGWDYNPAAWGQRLPIAGAAVVGFAVAGYMALYQWQLFPTVWDPFFGDGSRRVLNSWLSEAFPVPDAALGTFGYLLDAVAGVVGGRDRWRSMPWIVILFGIAVGPLGAVSILFVILQPLLFNAYCALCLLTAAISVVMIGPAMDEVLASLQYVRRASREGRSMWRAFWGLDRQRAE